MRVLILASLVASLAAPAFAADATEIDLVFKDGDLSVRLTGSQCEILLPQMQIPQVIPDADIRMAHVTQNGRDLRACWAVDSEDDVLVMTVNGGHGWIPLKAFKANSGI